MYQERRTEGKKEKWKYGAEKKNMYRKKESDDELQKERRTEGRKERMR